MKAGWKTVKLGDVAIVGAGNSAPQDDADFSADGPCFVRTSDVGEVKFGTVNSSNDRLSSKGAKGMRLWKAGTILIPKSGASTFVNHRVILGVDAHVSSHLATIHTEPTRCDARYLLYYLSTVKAQDLIQDQSYPSLKLPEIAGIDIPLPPLAEQKRIVALLAEAFAGIEAAKAKAEANTNLAIEILNSFLETEFNAENSELSPIGEIFTTMTGTTPPKSEASYYGKDVLFVKPPELRGGLITETDDGLTKEGAAVARIAPRNSILVSCIGILGKVGWVDKPVAFNQQINAILPREDHAHWKYMLFQMKSPKFRKSMTEASTGTTVYMVNKSNFNQLMVRLPSLSHQAAAAARFAEIDQLQNELEANRNKRMEALNSLKASLLAQAFAGELNA